MEEEGLKKKKKKRCKKDPSPGEAQNVTEFILSHKDTGQMFKKVFFVCEGEVDLSRKLKLLQHVSGHLQSLPCCPSCRLLELLNVWDFSWLPKASPT